MFFRSLAVAFVFSVVAVVLAIDITMNFQREARREQLSNLIATLEAPIAQAFWETDNEGVGLILRSLSANPEVLRISAAADYLLTDIEYEFVRPGSESLECEWRYERDFSEYQVSGGEIGSGTVAICMRDVEPLIVVGQSLLPTLIPLILVALLSAAVIFVLVMRMVVKPVSQLTSQANSNTLFSTQRDAWDQGDEISGLQNELNRQRDALAERGAVERAISEAIADGIVVTDTEFGITRIYNPELVQLAARLPLEEGMNLPQALLAGAYDSRSCRGELDSVEGRHISIVSVQLENMGHVFVFRDETERFAELDAAYSTQRLAALGQLSAGVAHDINNFLAIILANAELLSVRADLDQESAELVTTITGACDSGARLTTNLLSFSRGDLGEDSSFDVEVLLANLVTFVASSIPPKVKLETSSTANQLVRANFGNTFSVVLNLVLNSFDAISADEGFVSIRAFDAETRGKPMIAFEVIDSGSGIDPDLIVEVTKPFFTTKSQGTGTGLGLSTALAFTEAQGGELAIESAPGQGTRIVFTLPADSDMRDQNTASASTLRAGVDLNVLVLDDDINVARAVSGQLHSRGVQCAIETEPLKLLERPEDCARYGLIVCDVVMPKINGFDFQRRLREALGDAAPRFVFITGNFPRDLEVPSGAIVLSKPFDAEQIYRVVVRASKISDTAAA